MLDTVGWVFWPVKLVPDMTYNVFVGTLNTTLLWSVCVYVRGIHASARQTASVRRQGRGGTAQWLSAGRGDCSRRTWDSTKHRCNFYCLRHRLPDVWLRCPELDANYRRRLQASTTQTAARRISIINNNNKVADHIHTILERNILDWIGYDACMFYLAW